MKERGIRKRQVWWQQALMICLVLTMGISTSSCAGFLGVGGHSWQEEVLLHDGRKMVITRSQTYGGRHEIGQPAPIKEHTVTFTLPNTDKAIRWTSDYGEDLGRTNFHLLAVHVLNGTPYLVTEPNLCLSYNKWGRPNPPYVFFTYDGTTWQRIPLEAFPHEFTTINVALSTIGRKGADLVRQGVVSSEKIKEVNRQTVNPDHKTILREPVKEERCPQYSSGPKAPTPIYPSTPPK
ncbi:MAG: hypothetical protein HZC50_00930 [Nitrospirae bacterium]|nr:hypothetical protein [Nitrospirota bacterium]